MIDLSRVPKWAWLALGGSVALALGSTVVFQIAYAGGKVLGKIKTVTVDGILMAEPTAKAFRAMQAAAKAAGITLVPTSGFRTMEQQTRLWNLFQAGQGATAAKPGTSNHQNGRAVDISVGNSWTSPAYLWLAANAAQFGFSNDEGKRVNEPWHWVFTGTMNYEAV